MKAMMSVKAMSVKALMVSSLAAVMLCTTSASAATSMWKVSKGDDYVYLGGTIHLLPESAYPLPAEYEQVYKDTDTLVLEAKIPEADDRNAQVAMLNAMSYGQGEKLSDKLSPEVYQQLADYFSQYGIQLSQLEGFKPGFVALQMMAIEMQKAKLNGDGVDNYFAKRAVQDHKSQQYLESLESQINLLANMGHGYEDSFISLSLAQSADYKNYFDTMIAAWRQGDVAALQTLVVEPIQALDQQMYQDMLVSRNQAWLPQIEQMFGNEQRELVLVGAGHLAGEHSVLTLLQAAGYQLQQVTTVQ